MSSRRFKHEQEVLVLFDELPRLKLSTEYTEKNRAADFMAVFNGDSNAEQGRRVLAQISEFCNPVPTPGDADKPGMLAFKEGKRFLLGELMRCFIPKALIPEIVTRETQRGR